MATRGERPGPNTPAGVVAICPTTPVVLGMLLAIAACGTDPTGLGAPPRFTTVVFSYAAPTTTDAAVSAMFPQCVMGVNVTHLHAGWHDFQASPLTAIGADLWEIPFLDVPVGIEQRIRISDPNTCALNATGASTEGVSANGTLLTRVVDTPGTGIEPGLAFTVAADGSIDP